MADECHPHLLQSTHRGRPAWSVDIPVKFTEKGVTLPTLTGAREQNAREAEAFLELLSNSDTLATGMAEHRCRSTSCRTFSTAGDWKPHPAFPNRPRKIPSPTEPIPNPLYSSPALSPSLPRLGAWVNPSHEGHGHH
jgi:hypothetical protein